MKEIEERLERWRMSSSEKASKEIDFNKEIFSVLSGKKSSELTYLSFETRIRQLVLELIEPLDKNHKDIYLKFAVVLNEHEFLRRRLSEIEFIIK